jgi:hypothetical protein
MVSRLVKRVKKSPDYLDELIEAREQKANERVLIA